MTVIALVIGGVARADITSIRLDCAPQTTGASKWAVPTTAEVTDVGSGTETDSLGSNFVETADTEIVCITHVPADYLSSGSSIPTIWLSGWSTSNAGCNGGGPDKTVKFDVQSRAYAHGEVANASWSTADTASMSFACVTNGCGAGISCYKDDIVKIANADATVNVSDWNADELLYIRIVRDTGATDDLSSPFHLASVELRYDNNQ